MGAVEAPKQVKKKSFRASFPPQEGSRSKWWEGAEAGNATKLQHAWGAEGRPHPHGNCQCPLCCALLSPQGVERLKELPALLLLPCLGPTPPLRSSEGC